MSNISWNSFGNNNSNNYDENLAHFSMNNDFSQQQNQGTMFNITNSNHNKRKFDHQNNSFMNCDEFSGNADRVNENQIDLHMNNTEDLPMKRTKNKRRRMKVIKSPHHEKTAALLIQGQREYFQRCSGEISDLLYEEDYDDEESDFDAEQEAEIRKMNQNYHQKPFWPISSPRRRSSSVPVYVPKDTQMGENLSKNNISTIRNEFANLDNSYNNSEVACDPHDFIRKEMMEELRCQVCNELISHSLRQSLRNRTGNFDINEHSCSRCKKILCGLCCFNGDYGPISCFNCRYE